MEPVKSAAGDIEVTGGEQTATRSILVVDDNDALRQMLAWSFEDWGYLVWTASNCAEAIAATEAMAFDFALIDYHLPEYDGYWLAQRMAKRLPQARFILFSADMPGSVYRSAPNSSILAAFDKPLQVDLVRNLLDAIKPAR
jgi:two-component system, sensor histidine kinase